MPAALTIGQRQTIVNRRENGESFTQISQELNVSYGAVRNIYYRYVETGDLSPAYENCANRSIRKDEAIYHRAVEMKQVNPNWGAGLIWVELADEFDENKLPSVRTLQRWFRQAGVQHPPPERRPRAPVQRGKQVHEVWALDAKEQVELADGTHVSWLTVTDEGSGAILTASLFPHQTLEPSRSTPSQTRSARSDEPLGET